MKRSRHVIGLTLVITLCACAGKSRPAGEAVIAGKASRGGTTRDAYVAFVACVKKHGVRRAELRPGGGVSIAGKEDRVRVATRACAFHLPPADNTITPAEAARFRRELLAFTYCMRAHGLNLPNPKLTRLPGGFDVSYPRRAGEPAPQDDPLWGRARAACRGLNPLLRPSR